MSKYPALLPIVILVATAAVSFTTYAKVAQPVAFVLLLLAVANDIRNDMRGHKRE